MSPGRLFFKSQPDKFVIVGQIFPLSGSPMSILIVSANSLFKEVINEIITRVQSETLELNYEEALTRTRELRPDVIIIDETIPPPYFEDLLAEARNLEKTRIIVLNPIKNEIILLDSRRSTLREVDDLMEAISSTDFELNPTTQI
jgi:chemotaxis response regulator CheB